MKLKIFRIMAIIVGIIGTSLINRFMEGGALFMSLILSLFINLQFIFTVKSIFNSQNKYRNFKKNA